MCSVFALYWQQGSLWGKNHKLFEPRRTLEIVETSLVYFPSACIHYFSLAVIKCHDRRKSLLGLTLPEK